MNELSYKKKRKHIKHSDEKERGRERESGRVVRGGRDGKRREVLPIVSKHRSFYLKQKLFGSGFTHLIHYPKTKKNVRIFLFSSRFRFVRRSSHILLKEGRQSCSQLLRTHKVRRGMATRRRTVHTSFISERRSHLRFRSKRLILR